MNNLTTSVKSNAIIMSLILYNL